MVGRTLESSWRRKCKANLVIQFNVRKKKEEEGEGTSIIDLYSPSSDEVGKELHDALGECHFRPRVVPRKVTEPVHQRCPEDEWQFLAVDRAHLLKPTPNRDLINRCINR